MTAPKFPLNATGGASLRIHPVIIMSIPLSGNIEKIPLSDILEELRASKSTGSLSLRRGDVEKCIYIKDGQIIFATSTDARDRLGDSLVRAGKITKDNLQHAVQLYNKQAGLKKMGAILVESGLVPPKELFSGLKIQVKDIIFSLFLWRDGEFRFEKRLPSDVIQLHINIRELISEIIMRIRQEV